MAVQSSFATVAEQVIALNNNIIEVLSKINSLSSTKEASVEIRLFDSNGVINTYNLQSLSFFKSEIDRLSNSINSIYNIDSSGALIQTSNGKFKKIVTVDLNKEPDPISSLEGVSSFVSKNNWFFDGLLNPILNIELDLSNKIADNVGECLVKRYIIDFEKDEFGNLTSLGQSGLNSFNSDFRGQSSIVIEELEQWLATTPGVIGNYDEDNFKLEPNALLYDGIFNVINIEEDKVNRKLWYSLNTLEYMNTMTSEIRNLSEGDEVIINIKNSNTRFKVMEISLTESFPRVRFEMIEGFESIPVGIGTLKIYSSIIYTKKLRVSIGYNEYNIVFIKPINTNNILARRWSNGIGFYTGDLALKSLDTNNGKSLEQFYREEVYDYGLVLKDLVSVKKPIKYGIDPIAPILSVNNFKVSQINKHLTDSVNNNLLKNKHNKSISLKNEISQIEEAIEERNKKLRITRFTSTSAKKKFEQELDELFNAKNSKSKLLATNIQDILDLSRNDSARAEPKYRVRAFIPIPEPVNVPGIGKQEVVQMKFEYRYISKDGRENNIETFKLNDTQKASFSNWNEYISEPRKRILNKVTGEYTWEPDELENPEKVNFNQIDIPISPNELVEIRVKSISEVGWPEAPLESVWSEIITVEFPDELVVVQKDNSYILQEANKEDLKVSVKNDLEALGVNKHLSETTLMNNKTFLHTSQSILSGFKDSDGVAIDLYQYLFNLEQKVKVLEEKINRVKGELSIILIRTNQEFEVAYNTETEFNIECEDYLTVFIGTGIPTGRVYANNIYIIKDFAIKIKNKSIDSPLGLISNGLYQGGTEWYNAASPQTFWVNAQDTLLYNDSSGLSKTQLDNQFVWQVNYEAIQTGVVNRLAENIGNSFTTNNTNSITNILSQEEYNIGYSENQPINFISNNDSLLDIAKWTDNVVTIGSTTKFLTTIHPVVSELTQLVETNQEKVKVIDGNGDYIIPINIYFKMNSLDNTQSGNNHEYINLNNVTKTVKHKKKLKFLLQDESKNRVFKFTLVFNLNRNKVTFTSPPKNYNTVIK